VRIANDLRLLSSGPRTGLAEIILPPLQPGSSIMPGKVNPVMAEVTDMVGFQVIGADTAITLAAQAGQLELNVMMPVIAYNLLFALEILKNTVRTFAGSCVAGITANEARCYRFMEGSAGLDNSVIPWLKKRDIALLGWETPGYVPQPPGDLNRIALHNFVLTILGVHLIDRADFDALAEAAAARNRWEFMLTLAPLPIPNGTGSPVNPIATF
jgi:hypothetical protein